MKKKVLCFVFFMLFLLTPLINSAEKFGYKIGREDVFMFTQGNIYLIQAESIVTGGYYLYFAARDFTAKEDLTVGKIKKVDIKVDEPERKVIKTTCSLEDKNKKICSDYELELFTEIKKGFPFLVIYSKFKYLGSKENKCGINWGADSSQGFKYYTIPQKGEIKTYPLVKTKKTKIGQANWLFVNDGKGEGIGLIAPAVLFGRGESFVFINSVPRTKNLKDGTSIDTFMLFMPINKNFKILPELFEKIKDINWEY